MQLSQEQRQEKKNKRCKEQCKAINDMMFRAQSLIEDLQSLEKAMIERSTDKYYSLSCKERAQVKRDLLDIRGRIKGFNDVMYGEW